MEKEDVLRGTIDFINGLFDFESILDEYFIQDKDDARRNDEGVCST